MSKKTTVLTVLLGILLIVIYLVLDDSFNKKEELQSYKESEVILNSEVLSQKSIQEMKVELSTAEEDFRNIIEKKDFHLLKELPYLKDKEGRGIKKLYDIELALREFALAIDTFVESTNQYALHAEGDAESGALTPTTEELLTYSEVASMLEASFYESHRGIYELFIIVPVPYANPSVSIKWKKGVVTSAEYKTF